MGVRTIAVFSDAVQMRRQSIHFPVLFSEAVSARYLVDDVRSIDFAEHLRRHHVVGVVPIVESHVADSDWLAERLGLDWSQGATRQRFRDKYALKEFLRAVPDGPRINATAAVCTFQDVEQSVERGTFDRFVLKPNDGFGSIDVGFFTADDLDAARTFIESAAGRPFLMEEFLDGTEYFANGQIDEAGVVTVYRVGVYDKRTFNGRPNIKFSSRVVRTTESAFAVVVDYATHVMRASGLRRSPFHLELKMDDKGPCLVEVGARLCGTGQPFVDSSAHGTFDAFELAAPYFVSGERQGDLTLEWTRYDSVARGQVVGVASKSERVHELTGVAAVEALPEFRRWWIEPKVGMRVEETTHILASPYEAYFEAADDDALAAAFDFTRSTIRWNGGSSGLTRGWRRAKARVPVITRRARQAVLQPRLSRWND